MIARGIDPRGGRHATRTGPPVTRRTYLARLHRSRSRPMFAPRFTRRTARRRTEAMVPWRPMNDREGGCQCGRVRYRVSGDPLALVACHCKECQRQSGSAFGMSLMVRASGFTVQGELKMFERAANSGRTLRCFFCPECGTRIYHEPAYAAASRRRQPRRGLFVAFRGRRPAQIRYHAKSTGDGPADHELN